jgi:hypothetical protein
MGRGETALETPNQGFACRSRLVRAATELAICARNLRVRLRSGLLDFPEYG